MKFQYCMGIIDTLTYYNVRKKSEYVIKRVFQGATISCVPPREYCIRFCNFIFEAFYQEQSRN